MEKFRFLEWKVYKDSQDLFKLILKIVKNLPKEYRFELGSQLIRAALSVILNIAEGSGKTSDKELMRFLDISLGSLYEVLASTDVLKNNGLLDKKEFDLVYNRISDISNQLGGFKQKIRKENGL
jgi:four helix bundle protein